MSDSDFNNLIQNEGYKFETVIKENPTPQVKRKLTAKEERLQELHKAYENNEFEFE